MNTEAILRGPGALEAEVASFAVNLRDVHRVPVELTERVRAAAQATGYAEGWSEGHRAALRAAQVVAEKLAARVRVEEQGRAAALGQAVQAVARAASTLESRTAVDIEALEELVLQAAYRIAEAIVDRELALANEPGLDALRRALRLVPPDGPVTVLLNPADYAALTGTGPGDAGRSAGYEQVHSGRPVLLRPDPSLAPGDAVAECAATTVDARLAAAVQRAREALSS